MKRYHRQTLLPQIGPEGQRKLRDAGVLLVGCGALGTNVAEQLVRAGIGRLRIADRDVVELSNLQRQTLFSESDAREGIPKAEAAAARLRAINSEVTVEAHAVDVAGDNILSLAEDVDVIIDGTDNVFTRYLINDTAVRLGKPWVYGACVGVEGRVMAVLPRISPCLRCVFRDPPAGHELATCDTAGVLGSVAAIVASLQAILAVQLIVGEARQATRHLLAIDGWNMNVRRIELSDRAVDCPCCMREVFEFLDASRPVGEVLCGRDAVQVRPPRAIRVDLASLASRLGGLGEIRQSPGFLRFKPADSLVTLTVFCDGRAIVQGTADLARARSLYARYVGD